MCGRYYLEADDAPADLARLLEEAARRAGEPMPVGEIAPGQRTAVLAASRRDRRPAAFPMRWGIPTERGRPVINARSETAADRPLFAASLRDRRCLIPASAWFEWDHRVKPPLKYRIAPFGAAWFCLAGLYRMDREDQPVYAILTREAADGLREMHPRMPVALSPALAEAWLDPACDPAKIMRDSALTRVLRTPVRPGGVARQLDLFES